MNKIIAAGLEPASSHLDNIIGGPSFPTDPHSNRGHGSMLFSYLEDASKAFDALDNYKIQHL